MEEQTELAKMPLAICLLNLTSDMVKGTEALSTDLFVEEVLINLLSHSILEINNPLPASTQVILTKINSHLDRDR